MQLHRRESQRGSPIWLPGFPQVTQEVRHRRRLQLLGRPERQAADGAELLLELTGAAGVERQVTGIVRTRCQIVDHQPAVARDEELHAQQADELEPSITRRVTSMASVAVAGGTSAG